MTLTVDEAIENAKRWGEDLHPGANGWRGNGLVLAREIERLREMEKVLRQIAELPRKTREQRLASACVRFLDCMDSQPNAQFQRSASADPLQDVVGQEGGE